MLLFTNTQDFVIVILHFSFLMKRKHYICLLNFGIRTFKHQIAINNFIIFMFTLNFKVSAPQSILLNFKQMINNIKLQLQVVSQTPLRFELHNYHLSLCLYQFDVTISDNTASTGVSFNAEIYFFMMMITILVCN